MPRGHPRQAELALAETNGLAIDPNTTGTDGDTSLLSVATDASTTATPKKHKAERTLNQDTDPLPEVRDVPSRPFCPHAQTLQCQEPHTDRRKQDLLLPRTLITRLARGVLPANTMLASTAQLALQKAASVFVGYIASHANEVTSKKTIGPGDVLRALEECELGRVMELGRGPRGPGGEFVAQAEGGGVSGPMEARLEREVAYWEEVVRGKRKGYRDKVRASKGTRESGVSEADRDRNGHAGGDGGGASDHDMDESKDGEPAAKRVRRDNREEVGDKSKHHARGAASMQDQGQDQDQDQDETQLEDDYEVNDPKDRSDTDTDGDGSRASILDVEDESEEDAEKPPDDDEEESHGPGNQLRRDINDDGSADESD